MPVKVLPPQLPPILDLANPELLINEATLEGSRFEDADWTGKVASSVSLDEVIIERSILAEAKLVKFAARDAIFKHCDLSAAHCSEASLQRVIFSGGRMTGLDCSKGFFKDVVIENCKLDMTNFRFMKLTRVRFVGCMMADADFLGSELSEVGFEDCLLERADFSQSKLKNVDLRSSQLLNLRGWQYLKGATIDNVQLMAAAPYLANEIGIIVSD
jgi:uncharacterized protein YjbI with pentapeptide repeats